MYKCKNTASEPLKLMLYQECLLHHSLRSRQSHVDAWQPLFTCGCGLSSIIEKRYYLKCKKKENKEGSLQLHCKALISSFMGTLAKQANCTSCLHLCCYSHPIVVFLCYLFKMITYLDMAK